MGYVPPEPPPHRVTEVPSRTAKPETRIEKKAPCSYCGYGFIKDNCPKCGAPRASR